jgi:hypothetical protein
MAVFMMAGLFNQPLPAQTPVITSISPALLTRGTQGTFTITGANTSFSQSSTTLSPIPGVTVGTIVVNSPTSLTVNLTGTGNPVATPTPLDRRDHRERAGGAAQRPRAPVSAVSEYRLLRWR